MATLEQFLKQQLGGAARGVFENPRTGREPFQKMSGDYSQGDYEMTPSMMESARILGQQVMDLAKKADVDITQLDDIKVVMGYDKDPDSLTPDELGAYMIGQALAENTSFSGIRGFVSRLAPSFELRSNDDLAEELGRQVFGDNNPNASSVDTSTDDSMKPVYDNSPRMRF